MPLLVLGISHKTAPVEVRERFAFDAAELGRAMTELKAHPGIDEAVILSTCNRTELYCGTASANGVSVTDWMVHRGGMAPAALAPFTYELRDENAVRHLFRVAAGLDSMVVGEPQILGQLKDAHRAARAAGTVGRTLDRLIQYSFRVAKAVRTDTEVGAAPVSVAFIAVSLAVQVHGDLSDKTALLIGAGDTVNLAAAHLRERHVGRLIIANRSLRRADEVARRFQATSIPLTDIATRLGDVDIVISSTASRLPILTAAGVQNSMAKRRHRPIFMVDLAVPRDIEPGVGDLDDVYLYDIDNLQTVLTENLAARRAAAGQADELVNAYTQAYLDQLDSLDAVTLIKELRDRADRHRQEVLERAYRRLSSGHEAREVLEQAVHTLANRLLHDPTVQLHDPEVAADIETLATVRRLFSLDREGNGR